jgi:hypothetical protein
MKKYLILFALLTVFIVPVRANFSVVLDAGQLTGPGGVTSGADAMQIDNVNPSNNGSLILLIDIGSASSANTTIDAGSYVGTGDTILAAGGFNDDGGTQEVFTTLATTLGTQGDNLAILWFPQITYSQYKSDILTVAGDYFGTYTPSPVGEVPTDGGSAWVVPASGQINLDFFTANSDGGGNEPASDGYADDQVISAVPEPSSFAMVGLGSLLFLMGMRRLRSQAQAVRA